VEKRFYKYYDLHLMLSKKYSNLPKLPTKGFFKLNPDALEQRRKDLQTYVNGLAKRSDLRTDPFFRDFFELDLNDTSTLCYSPIKVTELNELPLGIRDFHYLSDKGLLFFALSEMKIMSRIDSYLTNINLPWEKKKDDTYSTVGAIIFYRVGLRESNGEWVFTRLWAKNFPVQTNILCWAPEKEIMFMGMDDGQIYGFSVVNKGISLSQDIEIKAHTSRVMGMAFDAENNQIMSISEDGKFKCSDISTQEPVHEESFGKGGLKALVHDKYYKRIFIGDGKGSVHIVSHVNYPPELIGSISSERGGCIRGM
jgi:WD40 repeat protein